MMQVAFEVHCRIHLRQFSAPFLKLARKYFPLDRDIFDFAMNLKYLKGNFFSKSASGSKTWQDDVSQYPQAPIPSFIIGVGLSGAPRFVAINAGTS